MKKILSLFVTLSLLCTGCSLIPKKVELFQSKVHAFPEPTSSQKELQKEAAQRAKEAAAKTLLAATAENTSTNVISPALEAAQLTDAVAASVGSPVSRSSASAPELADKLRSADAKYDKKVVAFAAANEKLEGKKVEGTGLVQVPYFLWAGGIVLLAIIFWHLAKTALTVASAANPGALVGVGAMNVTGTLAGKGLLQVVKGGKDFLKWVNEKVEDPALVTKISEAFVAAHEKAQDGDIKTVVKQLIK